MATISARVLVPPSLTGWSTHATTALRSLNSEALRCIAAVTVPSLVDRRQAAVAPHPVLDRPVPVPRGEHVAALRWSRPRPSGCCPRAESRCVLWPARTRYTWPACRPRTSRTPRRRAPPRRARRRSAGRARRPSSRRRAAAATITWPEPLEPTYRSPAKAPNCASKAAPDVFHCVAGAPLTERISGTPGNEPGGVEGDGVADHRRRCRRCRRSQGHSTAQRRARCRGGRAPARRSPEGSWGGSWQRG